MPNLIFIHGLESSGKGFKGRLFRKVLPGCLTPDFIGSLEERMAQLISILEKEAFWSIISSSFGGLMGTLYSCRFPHRVKKLILLAPYLASPELDLNKFSPINLPVVIYHGKYDKIVPLDASRAIAEQLFTNLKYNIVNDDHMLHSTVKMLDWVNITKSGE